MRMTSTGKLSDITPDDEPSRGRGTTFIYRLFVKDKEDPDDPEPEREADRQI